MRVNPSREVSGIGKFLLYGCLSLYLLPLFVGLLLIAYVFLVTIFPSTPHKERAIELLRYMSYSNESLASSKLVYSKHYQDILSSNSCFVFQYPKGYYDVSQSNFNYSNQNKKYKDEDFAYDYNKYMVENEGCSKFVNKLDEKEVKLFVEHDYRYDPIGTKRGLKIFINKEKQLIMFEGYLSD